MGFYRYFSGKSLYFFMNFHGKNDTLAPAASEIPYNIKDNYLTIRLNENDHYYTLIDIIILC